jgi:hypothetical protein
MGNNKGKSSKSPKEIIIAKYGMTQAIVIAIIGLIGTIAAAIFASPAIITWLKPSMPTETIQFAPTISNLASVSSVEVSSVTPGLNDPAGCQGGNKVIDGIVAGYPDSDCNEWASDYEGVGAWVKLSFNKSANISTIILYDRPNLNDHITSGELEFSDGTIIRVKILPNDGSALSIPVELSNPVQWVRFSVSSVSSKTYSVGLAEIEVKGFFEP